MDLDNQTGRTLNQHSPVIQLLNQGDQLTQQFQKQFNDSLTHVQALNSSQQQFENLSKLMNRSTTSPLSPVRQRTLGTLATTAEEASAGIRNSLAQMEATVESLSELLYKVDVYLAEPTSPASIGFDPANALKHLGNLFSAYQSELLAKRDLFFSFNCEEISLDQFVQQWKICDQIKSLTQETMDDLADIMGTWST